MSFETNTARLEKESSETLLTECIERLLPILTHQQEVSTMRVPVDFEHDDDAFVLERLRLVKRRLLTGDSR